MKGAGLLCGAALAVLAGRAGAAEFAPVPVTIKGLAIEHFAIGDQGRARFGPLIFRGGIEIEASHRAVGGLSGLLVGDGGTRLLAITDDGLTLRATIERNTDGRVTGLSAADLLPMTDADGLLRGKMEADSEAIDRIGPAADGGQTVLVSFEGRPRVMRGVVAGDGRLGPLEDVPLPEMISGLRWSKGLESLAAVPPALGGPGAFLVIAERPPHQSTGNDRPAWLVEGDRVRTLTVADDGFDITDARFGPDGHLYLLERLFSIGDGVRARLRRIEAGDIAGGATLVGATVLEADSSFQIDNMEGMDFWTAPDGRTMLSLLSDDNRSFLQRTVYLEFEVDPDSQAVAP